MKPGFDNVRAVKMWLDETADLIADRCLAEWRKNAYTSLFIYYEPSTPGTWGRFAVGPLVEPSAYGDRWKIIDSARLHGFMDRAQIWDVARRALNTLPILEPTNLDAVPPKAALHQAGAVLASTPCDHKDGGAGFCHMCGADMPAQDPAPAATEAEPEREVICTHVRQGALPI